MLAAGIMGMGDAVAQRVEHRKQHQQSATMNQALRHRDAAAGAQLQPHYATDDDLRQVVRVKLAAMFYSIWPIWRSGPRD